MSAIPFAKPDRSERRKSFRVVLKHPIEADLKIASIGGKPQESKPTPVPIADIGPGGICFLSSLNLPVGDQVVYRLETEILGKPRSLEGVVVRKRSIRPNNTEYGLKFSGSDEQLNQYFHLANLLALRNRNEPNARFGRRCSERLVEMVHKKRMVDLGMYR